MPCGNTNMPWPKLRTILPFGSNLKTVCSGDISLVLTSKHEFTAQRSATQMLLPSRSMSTALVDPHVRPSGSLAQPSIVAYGFGRSLTTGADTHAPVAAAGCPPPAGGCANTPPVHTPATATPAATVKTTLSARRIKASPRAADIT